LIILIISSVTIKRRRTRAPKEEMRKAYKIMVGNLKGRDHMEERGINGRILLRWILVK
jgi:hypothetical protein